MKKVFLNCILLLCALIVGSSNLWGKDYTQVYTFSSTTPTGWTSTASTAGTNSYAKMKSGEYVYAPISTLISNTEELNSSLSVNVSAGTYGSWSGAKQVTVTVSLLNSSEEVLSSANITKTSLGNSEGTYIASDYPIVVALPSHPENIAKVKVSFSIPNTSDVLRFKYLKINYSTRSTETSISAEDVNIACDATSGEISYSIINPNGSTLTATEKSPGYDWISDVAIANNKVTFTTTENEGAAREGYITLTYGSVTKDVKVTQAVGVTKYEVTIETVSNGTLVVKRGDSPILSGAKIPDGTVLTIEATPDEYYVFRNWQYKKGDGNWTTKTSDFTYTVDGDNVNFRANFTATHLVNWSINGTIVATNRIAEEKTIARITAPTFLNDKRFVGWSPSSIIGSTSDAPTILSEDPTMGSTDVTYYAVYGDVTGTIPASNTEIEIGNITSSDIIIFVGNNGSNYALPHNNGTTSAPSATAVTISGSSITSTISDDIKWNITYKNEKYIFYPNGETETWLYTNTSNNGVRVGSNSNKNFIIEDGYLKNSATNRYVGIYNSQDWRCYTSHTTTDPNQPNNIEGQTFKFYKYTPESYTFDNYCTSVSSMSVSLGANQWATYSFSMDVVVPSDARLKVYKAKVNLAGDALNATVIPAGSNIIAGEGLLLKATVADNYTFDRVTSGDVSAQAKNQLKGVLVATSADVLKAQNGDCEYIMVLNKNTGEFGSFTGTFPANRAYIPYTAPTNAPSAFRIVEEVENATDMKSLDANEGIVKFIKNGQIYIIREGVVYDALGRVIR